MIRKFLLNTAKCYAGKIIFKCWLIPPLSICIIKKCLYKGREKRRQNHLCNQREHMKCYRKQIFSLIFFYIWDVPSVGLGFGFFFFFTISTKKYAHLFTFILLFGNQPLSSTCYYIMLSQNIYNLFYPKFRKRNHEWDLVSC